MNRLSLVVFLAVLSISADARVVSYSPVTGSTAVPAVQLRTNRHYVLIETDEPRVCPVYSDTPRLVVYDSTGAEAPRVVFPPAVHGTISMAAALETNGSLSLLVDTNADVGGGTAGSRLLLSTDGGTSWKRVNRPGGVYLDPTAVDSGGPMTGGGVARTRIVPATSEVPFVFTTASGLYGVRADGTLVTLAPGGGSLTLVGSNRARTRFVVLGKPYPGTASGFYSISLDGPATALLLVPTYTPAVQQAWLTDGGDLYVHVYGAPAPFPKFAGLFFVDHAESVPREIAQPSFAIPTEDYRGAWLVERGPGLPTVLSRHTRDTGLVTQWSDVAGPELEALHAGRSGNTLLLQVHRPRATPDPRLPTFRDPALAIWHMGEPAPSAYDELFLIEDQPKGFVHLDVDAAAAGEAFVFDSGTGGAACFVTSGGPAPGGGSSGGGGDVIQEWGVVRGSLRQKLVIPAVARAKGAFGSEWRSELVLYNPAASALDVAVSFRPADAEARDGQTVTVRLAPSEIRVVADVLSTLFHVESGAGALVLEPEGTGTIGATSRTTTTGAAGSFGMGVGAVDFFTATGPRFPVTFAAALLGDGFRTNVAAVDTSGHGLTASLGITDGELGRTLELAAPAGGQHQLNDLASLAALPRWATGSLLFRPTSGETIPALVVIDNRTNDPTYFPPDLPAPFVRTIPALVHADGAHGARFRSDLVLSNTGDRLASVTLGAKPWTSFEAERVVTLTLLPKETKVVRDALLTIFGMSDVARLRFVSGTSLAVATNDLGVRVTSRTYTLLPDGGTFGLLIPPLNSFQSAGSGEVLEILGARGGAGYRTNLSLVELSPSADGRDVRVLVEVLDAHGSTLQTLDTTVPVAGGRQIDDLFRARGLGDGPEAALLRVRVFGGTVAAYATLIDQGTNDPVYLPAALAAR